MKETVAADRHLLCRRKFETTLHTSRLLKFCHQQGLPKILPRQLVGYHFVFLPLFQPILLHFFLELHPATISFSSKQNWLLFRLLKEAHAKTLTFSPDFRLNDQVETDHISPHLINPWRVEPYLFFSVKQFSKSVADFGRRESTTLSPAHESVTHNFLLHQCTRITLQVSTTIWARKIT